MHIRQPEVSALEAAGWPGLDQREAPVIESWDTFA